MPPSFPTRRASDLQGAERPAADLVDPAVQDVEVQPVIAGQPADHRRVGGAVPEDDPEDGGGARRPRVGQLRSEEHTSELQSLMRISYAVFCLKEKKNQISQYY